MKSTPTRLIGALGCLLASISPARADLLVYEAFAYPRDFTDADAGALDGKNGGIGFAGAWEDMTSGSNEGEGFLFDSSGNPLGAKPDWDGVIDNLPQGGGYIGLSPLVPGTSRNNARRTLAQSAGAMAGDDGILWVSMAVHFENNSFFFAPGLALTNGGGFQDRVQNLSDSANGLGIGNGGPPINTGFNVTDITASHYVAGTRDETTKANVIDLSTATADYVIVLKYQFGSPTDSVSVWAFTESATLSEAEFDANAVTLTSATDIDEDSLTTLAVGITDARNAFDEIRIGDTFADIISLPAAGPVEPNASTVEASPVIVPADGSTTSTITVVLTDTVGIPISGRDVSLSNTAGPGTPVIDPSSATTDANGVVTFTVKSNTVGVEEFTATDITGGGSVVISQTASVEFEQLVGPMDPAVSTVTAGPSSVVADGVVPSLVTVTLKDSSGLPIEGNEVTLANTAGPQAAVISPAGVLTTNANGQVIFSVTSTTPGIEVFTATDVTSGNIPVANTASVEFLVPDAPGLLVYEGFDYTVGNTVETPLDGGIGFSGPWIRAEEGANDSITVATGAPGTGNLDGVFNNPAVTTSPAGSGNRYIDGASGDGRITANRVLSQSAGALAGDDKVLWASVIWTMNGANFGRQVGFTLGTDGLRNRSQNISTSATWGGSGAGDAIGVGGAINTQSATPTIWDGGSQVVRTTTGAKNLFTNQDNIVILKYVFADGAEPDTVYAWAFGETETIDEATFNANAVSASAVIDQDTLNILSFGQSVSSIETIDEIRLGSTFADVLSVPLALITSFEAAGVPGVIDQSAKTISVEVPFATDLATLAPSFTLSSGASDPASGAVPSPTFAVQNPATYTVTDDSTEPPTVNTYTVTVTKATETGTLVIDLGTSPAGTEILGGQFIGSGPGNLPLSALPAGSILRAIAVDAKLEVTTASNFASDLTVLLDTTDPYTGDNFSLGIRSASATTTFNPDQTLPWAGGDGGVGTSLTETRTDSEWTGAIDLATAGLFLGNGFGSAPDGGTWSGTITLTYDIVSPGTPYETWATGNEPFDGDANGDGVTDGMAFLLGAANPDENAIGRLPTATDDGAGGLVLTFSILNAANRSPATAMVQWSSDLGATALWSANEVAVPETSGTTAEGVSFVVTPNGSDPKLNDVEATIPAGKAASGKLFARLAGTEN